MNEDDQQEPKGPTILKVVKVAVGAIIALIAIIFVLGLGKEAGRLGKDLGSRSAIDLPLNNRVT